MFLIDEHLIIYISLPKQNLSFFFSHKINLSLKKFISMNLQGVTKPLRPPLQLKLQMISQSILHQINPREKLDL
jgi:hypothetical protein